METVLSWVASSDWPNYVHLPVTLDYDETIKPSVLKAQEIDLREGMGRDFYRAIAAVLNNTGSVTGATVDGEAVNLSQAAYDALLSKLKPIIINYAYARHRETFDLQETRFGARVKNDAHSTAASDGTIQRTIHRHKSDAAHYLNELRLFLEDNASDYPDFVRTSVQKRQGTPRISSIWDEEPGEKWTDFPHGVTE